MSHDPIKPPTRSTWAKAVQEANVSIGTDPVPPVLHASRRRPDLWNTWLDVLEDLRVGGDGDEATDRLEEALRDPIRSEALVGALQTHEVLEGDPVAAYREREGIADKRNDRTRLKDVRKALAKLPDDYMAGMIPDLIAAALAVEDRPDAPQGHQVGRAARKAARALADLRALVVQAEEAAPMARGAQPKPETQARERLFRSVRRALNCPDDAAFAETCRVLWDVLTGAEELPDYKPSDR